MDILVGNLDVMISNPIPKWLAVSWSLILRSLSGLVVNIYVPKEKEKTAAIARKISDPGCQTTEYYPKPLVFLKNLPIGYSCTLCYCLKVPNLFFWTHSQWFLIKNL